MFLAIDSDAFLQVFHSEAGWKIAGVGNWGSGWRGNWKVWKVGSKPKRKRRQDDVSLEEEDDEEVKPKAPEVSPAGFGKDDVDVSYTFLFKRVSFGCFFKDMFC